MKEDMKTDADLDENLKRIWNKYNHQIEKGDNMNAEQIKEMIRKRLNSSYKRINWEVWLGIIFILPLMSFILFKAMVYRPTWNFALATLLVSLSVIYVVYFIIEEFIAFRKIDKRNNTLVEIMQNLNRLHYKRLKRKIYSYSIYPVFCIGIYMWERPEVSIVKMLLSAALAAVIFYPLSWMANRDTQKKISRLKEDIRILEDLNKKDSSNTCE